MKAQYYLSPRDIVPYSDVVGLIRCWDSIEILTPHDRAPLLDHTIMSPAYREYQQLEAHEALKTYRGHT